MQKKHQILAYVKTFHYLCRRKLKDMKRRHLLISLFLYLATQFSQANIHYAPYAYCAWNPIKLVDPDGRDVEIIKDDENKKVTIRADFYYNKKNLGSEADVFLDGFNNALKSWETDIKTALLKMNAGRNKCEMRNAPAAIYT